MTTKRRENEKAEQLLHEIAQHGIETKKPFVHPDKTNNRPLQLSLGRQFFNVLLPNDYPLINEVVNKKRLEQIVKDIYNKYELQQVNQTVSDIQYYSFKLSSIIPSSFHVDGLIPPPEWVRKKDEFIANPPSEMEEYNKQVKKLTAELIEHVKASGMNVHNVLMGGIKGNPIADWGALLVSKGYIVDIENNVIGPIKHSINDGYDPHEFYKSASEARRGFYYKSTAVQDPGYLSRKIAMANAKTYIQKTPRDCRTKKYFLLNITSKNHKTVFHRHHIVEGQIQLIEDTEALIGQSIKLRSPLYCKSPSGICPTCYGQLYEKLNTQKIGILASGAVNTVSINAYMKMRHEASQIEIIDIDFVQLLRDSKIDPALANEALTVEKNKIIAKNPIRVTIDRNDYDDKSLNDAGHAYILPGMIDLLYGDYPDMHIIHLPFSFKINLYKPENIVIDGKLIHLSYESGETLIHQDNYIKEVDPTVISKLFEAQTRYITDPEMLTMALAQQMPSIDLIHLETIVQNMFRQKDDLTQLARLNNYRNYEIVSQKKIPYIDSWLNSMAFENINKAISDGLLQEKPIQADPYENLILEKFNKQTG